MFCVSYIYIYMYSILETLIRKGRLIQNTKSQRQISCLSTFSDVLIEYLSHVIYKEETLWFRVLIAGESMKKSHVWWRPYMATKTHGRKKWRKAEHEIGLKYEKMLPYFITIYSPRNQACPKKVETSDLSIYFTICGHSSTHDPNNSY